ncbi:extracellular solute-binding protein [Chelativorans sp. Marseille-P2723]|uniref:extracellular solute-binding protein n=1 Tax=Chelativorans sp. Marseille-P2723 TaxID=2709133 RepID=UPI001570397D|nr:extracellular solute-binding protein [Chelativorans sp. Marseille-P2723]
MPRSNGNFRALSMTAAFATAALLIQTAAGNAWSLEEAAAPYKGVTIRTIGEALPPLEAMSALAPEFEERTGIKVEIEMYEHSEAVSKVMLDLNSRRGRYDFIIQPHRELGKFVTNGNVQPVDAFLESPELRDPEFKPEEQLYQGLWKEISWYDQKAFGFPFTALSMYMWYRSDLLTDEKEKEGFKAKYGYELAPAKNWDEYRDIAEWFTRAEEGLYGTALQGKRHEALWYEWLNFLYSFGGDMLEANSGSECGPVIVNSPQAIAATEYYKSLKEFSPPDTLNYFWDDVMALMQQGTVTQLIMWNDATYAVAVDESVSTVVGKMGFDMVPEGEGGRVAQAEGWTYLIPTASKNKEAAYLFIQWMMDYDQQLRQHLNGGATARPDVYASPEVQELPYAKASMAANEVAKPKPTLPQSAQMTDILVRELSSFLADEKTAKEALHRSAQEISALLGSCAPMKYPVE